MSPSLVRRCTIIRPVLRPITLAILLALSASPLTTHAALYTWTGAAGGNLWGTNGNWQSNQGNAVPSLNGLTDTDLFFGDRNTVSLNLGNAYGIRSLNFDVDARAYTFNGGSLTLGSGGLTHNAATAQSFNTTPVLLGADQTWTLASGAGALSFNTGVDTSGRALTINAATTVGSGNVINGGISGSGSLTKTGAGTLTLTGNNTHTGGTTFAAGVLNVGSAGAIGSSGPITFSGGTLQYSAANQIDYSARFSTAASQAYRIDTNGQDVTLATGLTSDSGSLSKSGAGTLTLSGASKYTGRTTVSGGTLAITGNVISGNQYTLTLVDGTDTNPAAINLSGSASSFSTGTVYVGGIGIGVVNQSSGNFNTRSSVINQSLYLGYSSGSSGSYNLSGNDSSLSTGSVYVGFFGSGTFNQNGGSFTTHSGALSLGSRDGSSGTYNLSGGSLTTAYTQVSGGVNTSLFTQTGGMHTTDWLSLSAPTASSQGTYNLNGGTLTTGTITSGYNGYSGGNSTFNFNGGTLRAKADSANFLQGLATANVQAGGARVDTAGFDVTIAQNLLHDTTTGAPAIDGGLVKLGMGTLTLTGTNTYTGGTIFAAGVLNAGSSGALGSSGTLLFNGGTLQYSASNQTDYSARFSTTAGQIYNIDTNGQNVTLATELSSAGGRLSKNGTGTLTLAGNNTYTGNTTVSGGTLAITGSVSSGAGSMLTVDGAGAINLSGRLVVGNVIGGASGTSLFNFNGGTLQVGAASTSFLQGLTTVNVQSGGARVDTAGFDVTIAQALLHDTTASAAAIDGGLTKLGAGTLTLTGTNTFNGDVNIAAGKLAVAGESNLGSGSAVNVNGSGSLLFTGSATLARTYNLGVSTLAVGSGNTLTLGSGAAFNGGFLNGPGTTVLGSGSTLNRMTAFANSTLAQTSGAATINGSTIRGALTQTGGTLAATNLFITSSGRISVGGTINTTGTEIFGVTIINSGGTLANSGDNLYLSGGSRTTINNGGTLSTAVGTSIELNGSQLINNGTQTGVLDINYGSLAKGSGSFGTVNIADGGKFSPGNSPGTATAQNFTFGAGGRYDFELNTASPIFGTNSDLLKVTDTLFITAGTTPNSVFTIAIDSLNQGNQAAALSDFNSSLSYHYLLVDANSISGFDSSKFIVDTSGFYNNLNGGSFSISQSGNDLYLDFTPTTVTAVPEPATWVMWLAALTMGVGLQQRRRKQG